MEKFSDISSAEETDNDNPVNTDVFKLFDYENEMEQSFSGFEKEQCNEASNYTINVKTLQSSRRSRRTQNNGHVKGPGKNLEKKLQLNLSLVTIKCR